MAFKSTGLAFQKCYTVPGRRKSRTVTAKSVGSMACYARRAGVTVDELLDALRECAPCRERRSRRNQQRLEAVLQANSGVLRDSEIVLTVLETSLDAFMLVSRFVPMLRAVAPAVYLARRPVASLVTRIRARRAANDELYEMIIREAAS